MPDPTSPEGAFQQAERARLDFLATHRRWAQEQAKRHQIREELVIDYLDLGWQAGQAWQREQLPTEDA